MPAKNKRHLIVSATRRNVQFARRELSQPGNSPSTSGPDFSSTTRTCPSAPHVTPTSTGEPFPGVVLAQLLDENLLAALGGDYLEYRVAFELMAHSGRRPGEICGLAADCLRYEGNRPRMAASSAARCCATCARSHRASG